jgi:hypothetical protein
MTEFETYTFALSTEEVEIYDFLCREVDVDPQKYRSSRRVEAPMFHCVDLMVAFVRAGTELSPGERDKMFEHVADWEAAAGGILDKFTNEVSECGDIDRLQTMAHDEPRLQEEPDGPSS